MQPGGRGDRPTGMKAPDLRHPLTAARPLAAAAALACALAMASGLATAGCTGPPPRAGSPATAGSPVPASVTPRLTAIGGRAAAANGDTAPLWMTAVLTTHAKALTSATPGDFVPGTGDIPVFLITMRGDFAAFAACGSSGADRQVPVHRRRRRDLPGARLRPEPQPAAGLARQPRTGHVPGRSPALTDSPYHDVPLHGVDAPDTLEPPLGVVAGCAAADQRRRPELAILCHWK